jgi:hypothetical protein
MRDEDNSKQAQHHYHVFASSAILARRTWQPRPSNMLNELISTSCREAFGMCGQIMFKVEIFLAWIPFPRRSPLHSGDQYLVNIPPSIHRDFEVKIAEHLYESKLQALTRL